MIPMRELGTVWAYRSTGSRSHDERERATQIIPLDRIEPKFTTIGKESDWCIHTLKDNHQKWP